MKTKLTVLLLVIFVFSTMIISNAEAVLTLDKEEYTIGETVTVTFKNADGNEMAWIAIYPEGEAYTEYQAHEKVWKYANTDTETNGETAIAEGSVTLNTEGLVAGEYHVSYFIDGAYNEGSSASFKLVEKNTENPATSDNYIAITSLVIVFLAAIVLKRKSISI